MLLITAYRAHGTPVVSFKSGLFVRTIDQIMEPLTLSITILETISWMIGGAFIFGAIGRYLQYRDNPGQSPIGKSFFLGALGIVLILLPVIGQYALAVR